MPSGLRITLYTTCFCPAILNKNQNSFRVAAVVFCLSSIFLKSSLAPLFNINWFWLRKYSFPNYQRIDFSKNFCSGAIIHMGYKVIGFWYSCAQRESHFLTIYMCQKRSWSFNQRKCNYIILIPEQTGRVVSNCPSSWQVVSTASPTKPSEQDKVHIFPASIVPQSISNPSPLTVPLHDGDSFLMEMSVSLFLHSKTPSGREQHVWSLPQTHSSNALPSDETQSSGA